MCTKQYSCLLANKMNTTTYIYFVYERRYGHILKQLVKLVKYCPRNCQVFLKKAKKEKKKKKKKKISVCINVHSWNFHISLTLLKCILCKNELCTCMRWCISKTQQTKWLKKPQISWERLQLVVQKNIKQRQNVENLYHINILRFQHSYIIKRV